MTSNSTDRIMRSVAGGAIPVTGETITVSVTAAAAVSTTLEAGVTYELKFTQDMHVCSAPTAVATATTSDALYFADEVGKYHTPDPNNLFLSAIRSTTDGTLYIIPIMDTVQ